MPAKHIDTDDVLLLISVIVSVISTIIDEIDSSTLFKVLKVVGLLLTLWFAVQRIRQSKPYFLDIEPGDWKQVGKDFEFHIPRSQHGRGRFPYSRCLVQNDRGEYAECFADAIVGDGGGVSVRLNQPSSIRVEVRK